MKRLRNMLAEPGPARMRWIVLFVTTAILAAGGLSGFLIVRHEPVEEGLSLLPEAPNLHLVRDFGAFSIEVACLGGDRHLVRGRVMDVAGATTYLSSLTGEYTPRIDLRCRADETWSNVISVAQVAATRGFNLCLMVRVPGWNESRLLPIAVGDPPDPSALHICVSLRPPDAALCGHRTRPQDLRELIWKVGELDRRAAITLHVSPQCTAQEVVDLLDMCEAAHLDNHALGLLPDMPPEAPLPCRCPPRAERLFPDPKPTRR